MRLDTRNQQFRIGRALLVYLERGDDLILPFLNLDHLAEFGGLARLALTDDFGARLEDADQLLGYMRVATENSRTSLLHHLLHPRRHRVQLFAQAFEGGLFEDIARCLHARRDLAREALRLSHHSRDGRQQLFVSLLQPLFASAALAACGPSNLQKPVPHASTAIPQLSPGITHDGSDPFHRARQNAHPISQQTAVGRIVDIGFDDGRVDAHLAALDDLLLLRDCHDPFVEALNYFWSQGKCPLIHDGIVWNLTAADTGEGSVDQVGAHFALHHFIAPVANVLEQEQSQNDFSGRAPPAPGSTLGASFGQGFVHSGQQLIIVQNLVRGTHPVFPQIGDFLVNESFGEAELGAAGLNHGVRSGAGLPCGSFSPAAIAVAVAPGSGRPGNTRSSRRRPRLAERDERSWRALEGHTASNSSRPYGT